MKLLALSLLACSFASCASPRGFQRTAMDQTRHFGAQPMDQWYGDESRRMILDDAGHPQYHIGAGPWHPISYEHWLAIGAPGMFACGTGTISGDHAVQDARYLDHGHIVKCGIGPISSAAWKNGERKPWERWGPDGVEHGH